MRAKGVSQLKNQEAGSPDKKSVPLQTSGFTDLRPAAAAQRQLIHLTAQHQAGMQMAKKISAHNNTGRKPEAQAVAQRLAQKNMADANKTAPMRSASANVAQLYSTATEGNIWGYGKGKGGQTPNFEFQEFSANKVVNDAASTIDYGIDADQVTEEAPALRVADDRSLAVPTRDQSESKSFFATPARINESNLLLHNAGAPLRLNQGGGQIRLSNGLNPFGPTLNQVSPDLTNVVNNSSECGVFAQNILGTPVHNAETNNAGVAQQIPGLGGATQTPGRDTTINNALNGQNANTLGANENADPEVGEAFGIYARTNLPQVGRATAIWNGIVAVQNRLTQTTPHLQWGEHWAGVVAKSGSDYVTLENYNRGVSDTDLVEEAAENDFEELKNTGGIAYYMANTQNYATQGNESKLQRLARLGRNYMKYAVQIGAVTGHYRNQMNRWYFQMYGSGGKSFHEQWKNSAPNAVTFKTRGTDAQLRALLVNKLNALLPADNYQAGAAATLLLHTGNINAAVGRANITAAFVAAEKAVCLARLSSARTYWWARRKRTRRATVSLAYNQAVIDVNAAAGDRVNAQCVAGILKMERS